MFESRTWGLHQSDGEISSVDDVPSQERISGSWGEQQGL